MNIRVNRFRSIVSCAVLLAALAAISARWSLAQSGTEVPGEAEVRAHYTKYEYRVPMRDGVKLFTSVYVPKTHPRRTPSSSSVRRTVLVPTALISTQGVSAPLLRSSATVSSSSTRMFVAAICLKAPSRK